MATRAVDVARLLYDVVRPQPAPDHWPAGARWPYHGLPGALVVDADRLERDGDARAGVGEAGLAGPVLAPEAFVVDYADPPVMPTETQRSWSQVCQDRCRRHNRRCRFRPRSAIKTSNDRLIDFDLF